MSASIIDSLTASLDRPFVCDTLFDSLADTIFFVKNAKGQYAAVNLTLVQRTGRRRKDELIGLTADEVFRGELGRRIAEQDLAILKTARSLKGELELHLYPGGEEGWCLTWKEPLLDRGGAVAGLVGLSRDVSPAQTSPAGAKALSAALHDAQRRPDAALKVADLAARAGLSVFQLDQRIRAMFGLSAGQYLVRLRIEHAIERLRRSADDLSQIALDCGYADQTAFARQFRKIVGVPPGQYRKLLG
jgi:AraC-like DNA-binding protein